MPVGCLGLLKTCLQFHSADDPVQAVGDGLSTALETELIEKIFKQDLIRTKYSITGNPLPQDEEFGIAIIVDAVVLGYGWALAT